MGNHAFTHCSSLESIIIPKGITILGLDLFQECTSLLSVGIPKSVTQIMAYTFIGCDSLRDIYYEGDESDWDAIEMSYINNISNATIHYMVEFNSRDEFVTPNPTIYETFNYDNEELSVELAMTCAELAAYAYEDYFYDLCNDLFYQAEDCCRAEDIRNILVSDDYNYKDVENHCHDEKDIFINREEDGSNFVIGHKKINYNGEKRELTVIVIRGTDGIEWFGNMDIGGEAQYTTLTEHYSFGAAADSIATYLETYLADPDQDGKTDDAISDSLMLITGHSRGGAVGNLLAYDLTVWGVEGVDSGGVYAYLFACPSCTKEADKTLTNIYNICFSDDFVPRFPLSSWGYGRHGLNLEISAQGLYNLSAQIQRRH